MDHDPSNPAEATMFRDFDLSLTADEMTIVYMVVNHVAESSKAGTLADITQGLRDKLGVALADRVERTLEAAIDAPLTENLNQLLNTLSDAMPEAMVENLQTVSEDGIWSVIVDLDETPDRQPEWLLHGDEASKEVRSSELLRRNAAWVHQMVFGIMTAEHIGIPAPAGLYFPDGLFASIEITQNEEACRGLASEVQDRGIECAIIYGHGNAIREDANGIPDLVMGHNVLFHYRGRDGRSFGFMVHPHNDKPGCDNPACINVHASYHVMAGVMKLSSPESDLLDMMFPSLA